MNVPSPVRHTDELEQLTLSAAKGGKGTAHDEKTRACPFSLKCHGQTLVKASLKFKGSFWPLVERHR